MSDLGVTLTRCRLQVRDSKTLSDFYTRVFGMKQIQRSYDTDAHQNVCLLGYPQNRPDKSVSKSHDHSDVSDNYPCTYLELAETDQKGEVQAAASEGNVRVNCEKRGCYWKIGVNVYDVELAARKLAEAGVDVSEPLMIPGVGHLCHVLDPEGYDTELMQFTLSGALLPHTTHNLCTIGQQAVFSVITLRVQDMAKSLGFYQGVLGLRPVCRQNQTDYGLDIYYLSCQSESPPSQDLEAPENVEWTYQRPDTLLELVANIRHEERALGYQPLSAGQYGFKGLGMSCGDLAALKQHLISHGVQFTDSCQRSKKQEICVNDPDSIPIRFLSP